MDLAVRAGLLPAWLAAFLAVAGAVMLGFAALVPFGEGPDEPAHVVRVAGLLRGQLLGHRVTEAHPVDGQPFVTAGFDINPGYLWVMNYRPRAADGSIPQLTQADMLKARGTPWLDRTVYSAVPNTAVYAPVLYVPSAVGMGVARLSGAGPYVTVLCGRLVNVLAYLVIAGAALLLADRGRVFLAAILLLPMSLFIGSCVGQDGLIIALAGLGAAALGRGRFWLGTACIALIVLGKPPYLPLALLPLSVPGVVAAAVPGLAWTGLATVTAAVPFYRVPYAPGPLWTGAAGTMFRATDPSAQLHVLLAHPARLLTMPWAAVVQDAEVLGPQFVGVLSWLDILLPDGVYAAWYWVLGAGFVLGLVGGRWRLGWGKPLVLVGVLGAVVALFVAQYVNWSAVGAARMDGVQGRYLIPVAALAALLMPAGRVRRWEAVAMVVPLGLGAWSGVVALQLVLARYYLP